MSPKRLMMDVAERAYWCGVLEGWRMRSEKPKPGEFWQSHLSEEEREILRGITSQDISNVRIDGVYVFPPR